jgi:hypothetical protein
MLDEYVFVDEDFKVILEAGLHDGEVAEQRALKLSAIHKKTVICYKRVCICDTFDLSAMREALKKS